MYTFIKCELFNIYKYVGTTQKYREKLSKN